ncbi:MULTISPECIES: RHS repeat-associated core domain-containing protein [unclassified Pseudoxanthomonas]|uniref:RHS repeat-associated core domain-containing protein n=1 Tax=unclassified Pseudoxanthomonas TaxID=2645906 RepID=UPI003076D654
MTLFEMGQSGSKAASVSSAGTRFHLGVAAGEDVAYVDVYGNHAPELTLTAPANGAAYRLPATVTLAAAASDSDGGINRVEFWAGGARLGSATASPYSFAWANPPAGTHSVTAIAFDSYGHSRTSAASSITLKNSDVYGAVDGIQPAGATDPLLKGWACSTGRTQSIDVHVYMGGPAGSGTMVGSFPANKASEAAVAAACESTGTAYRFEIPLTSAIRQAHAGKAIYVHGISPVGRPNNLLSGSGATTVPGDDVLGVVEGIYPGGAGDPLLLGWACSTHQAQSIDVHVYMGGPAGSGTMVGSFAANKPSEAAIAAACESNGTAYRFEIPLTPAIRQAHVGKAIYVHGISPVGRPNNLLSGSGAATVSGDVVGGSTFKYDELGRLIASTTKSGNETKYTYDNNDNLLSITDPLGKATSFGYDPLGRLASSKDADGYTTSILYDAGDRIVRVTDPRDKVTSYTYDGFGQLWAQSSPDTGTTRFTYDATGLRTSMTRADARVTTLGYDGLARLTSLTTDDGTQTFTYDSCLNGKGMLCKVADPTGSVEYTYTPQGQIASQVSALPAGGSDAYAYSYDGMGRLTGIGYPGGVGVGYGYSAGQLTAVTATVAGVSNTVASGIKYQPFGPAASWTYGNGLTRGYNYDQDGRRTGLSVRNGSTVMQSLTLGYDRRDMVTAITNAVTPSVSQIYRYDDLGRLIREERDANRYNDYTYDASGNRTSAHYAGTTTNYTVSEANNRLLNVDTTVVGYDPNGNVTSDGVNTFVYDAFNRMSSATRSGGTASYAVNGLGQRVYKEVGTTQTWFSYAPDGSLIGEYKSAQGWTAYVWANDEIIGMVRGGQLYSVHNDHIGRPEQITDSAKAVVWKADNYGFSRVVTQDAVGAYNIGFPGQYYDAETDTWNNGFRTYSHSIGRYLQSDPIGLAGGVNTYAYVGGNPLNFVDPLGLQSRDLEYIYKQSGAKPPPASPYFREYNAGVRDFVRNYRDMRKANTKLSDKYFHCKANCEAAQRGPGGKDAACKLSDEREKFDKGVKGDSAAASAADQAANRYGRNHAGEGSCSQVCSGFRPNGLPPEY